MGGAFGALGVTLQLLYNPVVLQYITMVNLVLVLLTEDTLITHLYKFFK